MCSEFYRFTPGSCYFRSFGGTRVGSDTIKGRRELSLRGLEFRSVMSVVGGERLCRFRRGDIFFRRRRRGRGRLVDELGRFKFWVWFFTTVSTVGGYLGTEQRGGMR